MQDEIQTVSLDGTKYGVKDLTPRVVEGFNMLVKLQAEIKEQAYEMQKLDAAQTMVISQVKQFIEEDKIKEHKEDGGEKDTAT